MSLLEEWHCDSDNHSTETDANNNCNRIRNINLRDKIFDSLIVGTEVWYLTDSTDDDVSLDKLPQLIDISDSETESDDSDSDSDSSEDDSEERSISSETESAKDEVTSFDSSGDDSEDMSMSSETESAEEEATTLPDDSTMDRQVPLSKMEVRKKHIQVSDLFASQQKLNTKLPQSSIPVHLHKSDAKPGWPETEEETDESSRDNTPSPPSTPPSPSNDIFEDTNRSSAPASSPTSSALGFSPPCRALGANGWYVCPVILANGTPCNEKFPSRDGGITPAYPGIFNQHIRRKSHRACELPTVIKEWFPLECKKCRQRFVRKNYFDAHTLKCEAQEEVGAFGDPDTSQDHHTPRSTSSDKTLSIPRALRQQHREDLRKFAELLPDSKLKLAAHYFGMIATDPTKYAKWNPK